MLSKWYKIQFWINSSLWKSCWATHSPWEKRLSKGGGGCSHCIEEIEYDCYFSELLKKLLIHLSFIYPFYIAVCCRLCWAMLVICLGAWLFSSRNYLFTLFILFWLLLSYFKFKLMTVNTSSYTYCNCSRVQIDRRWCRNKRRKGRGWETCWKKT